MSVVIKGMEMPDSCRHCCMMTGTFCDILNIDVDPYYDGAKHRNVWCPLVKLPKKHGRLFDTDEVVKCLEELALSDCREKVWAIGLLEWAIKKRWCIEAEGEG